MPREDQNSSEAHLTVKKLFVAGLKDGIDENILREYFSRFGNVTEVLIMKDRDGRYFILRSLNNMTSNLGKHRGFAFVSFDDYDAVDKAILAKPHIVNDKTLDIKKAIPKEKMQDSGRPSDRQSMPPSRSKYDQSSYPSQWENPPEPSRMPPSSSYHSQGYNTNNSNPYPSSYSTNMGQNYGQSLMNYDGYNNSNNNNSSTDNYLTQPPLPPMPSSTYGANQTTSYHNMNMPFGLSTSTPSSGYNDGTTSSNFSGNNNNNHNYE